ncbi:MAG: hypothetical protein Fur0035_03930 [Anaerolineales bacterium]
MAASGILFAPSDDLRVWISWVYRDERRLGLEIRIYNYPVPQGYQAECPLTQLRWRQASGELTPLYAAQSQFADVDEFNAANRSSRWYCAAGSHPGEYIFSLIYFGAEQKNGPIAFPFGALEAQLGSVYAWTEDNQQLLPAQGNFWLPYFSLPPTKRLTWIFSPSAKADSFQVENQLAALNPSFALLETCITAENHAHFWQPQAFLQAGTERSLSEFSSPTFPFPADFASALASPKRCYALIIPHRLSLENLPPFEIGLDHIQVMRNDANTLTMQECEQVNQELNSQPAPIRLRCYPFTLMNQALVWFQITQFPPGMTEQEAYSQVEEALIQTIPGPWAEQIVP